MIGAGFNRLANLRGGFRPAWSPRLQVNRGVPELLQAVTSNDRGQIVAVGTNAGGVDALILSSLDYGDTWTERTNPKVFSLNCVGWGLGLFITMGNFDGGDTYCLTSPDGVIWTERVTPATQGMRDIAINSTVAVTVGNFDGVDAAIYSSLDGINWTARVSGGSTLGLAGVVWAPELGLFCAVGGNAALGSILTSPDGTTWTQRTDPMNASSNGLRSVVWTGALFVATGTYTVSAERPYVLTSRDGLTWTLVDSNLGELGFSPTLDVPISLTWAGTRIYGVFGSDTPPQSGGRGLCSSVDGSSWSIHGFPPNLAGCGTLSNGLCWTGALRGAPTTPIGRGQLIAVGRDFGIVTYAPAIAAARLRPRAWL